MHLPHWTVVLSLLLGIVIHQVSASEQLDITKATRDVVDTLTKAWHLVDQNFTGVPIPIVDRTKTMLFERIEMTDSKLTDLNNGMDSSGAHSAMLTVLHILPQRVKLGLRLDKLLPYMNKIDLNYRTMQDYVTGVKQYDRKVMEEFARNVTNPSDPSSVVNLVQRIHAYIVSDEEVATKSALFELLVQVMQDVERNVMCSIKQSPQQVIWRLYRALTLTELKGYTMIQFSYMLLKLYGKGFDDCRADFTQELRRSRETYQKGSNDAVDAVKRSMSGVSRELWKCDPDKHAEGETYEEITKLLQGYVQNQQYLNPENSCMGSCSQYSFVKKDYEESFQSCKGKIIDCKFIDSDMSICKANPSSKRRYDYIAYDNGRVLGRNRGWTSRTTRVTSWSYHWFWECSYCFCHCDQHGLSSDRYFNMRSAISDIRNNKVVTGLRFVKKNRVIHLQIQQGEFLPRMAVNASTVTWKTVEDYNINDRKMFNGQEFHTINWQKRQLDLDDLEADEGYILTGVRFKEIGTHLNFEIYITKFDFDTGKLKPEHSKWKDNPNLYLDNPKPRKKVLLTRPDVPTRTTKKSIPTSHSDQYIEFTYSDIDKDAAQTTVPFLDAQKVESLHPVPLTGAGLFHKGRPDFGGFITPKIITYDVNKYLHRAFPTEEDVN